jgi:hypothetical protein
MTKDEKDALNELRARVTDFWIARIQLETIISVRQCKQGDKIPPNPVGYVFD